MNVLFLTHRLPYAPNRGDRYRAYHLLKAMSTFANVTLFSLVHDQDEIAHLDRVPFAHSVVTARAPRLRNLLRGVMRLTTNMPLTHSLLDSPSVNAQLREVVEHQTPDIVVAFCSGMARFALEPPLARLPLVLDMVDVDSEKWRLLAVATPPPLRWIYAREAKTLAAFETRATRAAATTLVVNDRERAQLSKMVPGADVRVIQNGIDLDAMRPSGPPAGQPVVVFCGVMNYQPNVEGVLWFSKEVWPQVRAVRPDATFVVVGSSPTRAVRALGASDSSIRVVGSVPEVQPYLHSAAVAVAPLQIARGVQNKVIEALAAGLPVVVTPVVMDGLPNEARPGCTMGDGQRQFAEAVIALLGKAPVEQRQHAQLAKLEGLTWAHQLRDLETILVQAADRGSRVVSAG